MTVSAAFRHVRSAITTQRYGNSGLAGARALRDEALDLSLAIHINRNMALCLVAFAGWREVDRMEQSPGLARP